MPSKTCIVYTSMPYARFVNKTNDYDMNTLILAIYLANLNICVHMINACSM